MDKAQLIKKYEKAVDARLNEHRAQHVHSVSDFAVRLANFYGADNYDARVAGLLHDWDKIYSGKELLERMKKFDIEIPEKVELLYPVLHCFTGARAVKKTFPEISDAVESAIFHHTLAGVHMSNLDKIIYISDSIEPLRSSEHRPQLEHLRWMVGKESLDDIFWAVYEETMHSLITRKLFIHPMTLEIYNGLVAQYRVSKEDN